MGQVRKALPAKLFIGMLSPDPGLFSRCAEILSAEYGGIDLESEVLPWDITDYYREEMGDHLLRKFVFFRNLINPDIFPRIKHFTHAIEERLSADSSSGSRRTINLDPGYVTEAKVILATTKDYAHRVYIGEGIYAEVTLQYGSKERSFITLPHTYFDFRADIYKNLFNKARGALRERLNRQAKECRTDGGLSVKPR